MSRTAPHVSANSEGANTEPSSNAPSDALMVFMSMWTAAAIFHSVHRADVIGSVPSSLMFLAALWFLLRPSSIDRFACFCVAHASVFFYHSPDAGNHEFFAFYADAVIVLSYAGTWVLGRSRVRPPAFFAGFAPLLRLGAITLYFFAVFHKLNTWYLDPSASCGATLPVGYLLRSPIVAWLHLGRWFPIDSNGFRLCCIWTSLTVEAFVLLSLVVHPRLIPWGIVVGSLLHCFLGIFFFWHFTPMVLALYSLFLAEGFHTRTAACARRVLRAKLPRCQLAVEDVARALTIAVALSLPFLFVLTQSVPWLKGEIASFSRTGGGAYVFGFRLRTFVGWLPFVLYSGLFLAALRHSLRRGHGRLLRPRLRPPTVFLVFPVALFLNGFSPYLGLKNHQSFSMFSNLTTHGGHTNHLFMPLIEIVGTQRDMVSPIDLGDLFTGSAVWGPKQTSPMRIAFFELHKQVSLWVEEGRKGIRVSYVRDGRTVRRADAENDAELAAPVSWFDHKFRIFKAAPDYPKCFY